MRDLAERITRFKWLQTLLYWVQYLLLTTLIGFPWSSMRTLCGSTSMAWRRRVSAPGWAMN